MVVAWAVCAAPSPASAASGERRRSEAASSEEKVGEETLANAGGFPPEDKSPPWFSAALDYQGEVFRGFDLVPDGVSRYAGLVDLSLRVDTAAAGWWRGGELFAVAENGHGGGFRVETGGLRAVTSNIVAPTHTELSQWGYRQAFARGRASVRVGRQDVNRMFCVNGPGGGFIEPWFTLIPTVPMPTFPAPAVGLAVDLEPVASAALRLGVFDGGARIDFFGIDPLLDHEDGTFSVLEPAWKPAWGADGRLRGSYRLGVWYHTGTFRDLRGGTADQGFARNYGAYLMAEQPVSVATRGHEPALSVFLQVGWAPPDRNAVARYVGLGFSSTGAPLSRRNDALGLAVSRTWTGGETRGGRNATMSAVELFYQIGVAPWLVLQPDIQYFARTGRGRALAVGLRWSIRLPAPPS